MEAVSKITGAGGTNGIDCVGCNGAATELGCIGSIYGIG